LRAVILEMNGAQGAPQGRKRILFPDVAIHV